MTSMIHKKLSYKRSGLGCLQQDAMGGGGGRVVRELDGGSKLPRWRSADGGSVGGGGGRVLGGEGGD